MKWIVTRRHCSTWMLIKCTSVWPVIHLSYPSFVHTSVNSWRPSFDLARFPGRSYVISSQYLMKRLESGGSSFRVGPIPTHARSNLHWIMSYLWRTKNKLTYHERIFVPSVVKTLFFLGLGYIAWSDAPSGRASFRLVIAILFVAEELSSGSCICHSRTLKGGRRAAGRSDGDEVEGAGRGTSRHAD